MQHDRRGEKRSRDKTFGDPKLGGDDSGGGGGGGDLGDGGDSGSKRERPTGDDDRLGAEKSAAGDRDGERGRGGGGGGGESKSEPVTSPSPETDTAKKSACATPLPTNTGERASLFFVGACGHAVVCAVDEPTRRCIARHAVEYVRRLISSAPPPASLLELVASDSADAATATATATAAVVASASVSTDAADTVTTPSTAHVPLPLAVNDAAETLVAWENAYTAFNAAVSDRRELLARRGGALALIRAALWLTRSDLVAAEMATAGVGLWLDIADGDGGASDDDDDDDKDGWGRFSAASNVLRAHAMAIRKARHAPRFRSRRYFFAARFSRDSVPLTLRVCVCVSKPVSKKKPNRFRRRQLRRPLSRNWSR